MMIALLGLTALLAGPALTGCKSARLEPGGAYAPLTTNDDLTVTPTQAPDLGLFVADQAFDLAVSTMGVAFKIERDNRMLLWRVSPEIKHGLDRVRPQAVEAKKRYALARTAYLANPIPGNLDTLNTVLAELKALSEAAQAAIPQEVTKLPDGK